MTRTGAPNRSRLRALLVFAALAGVTAALFGRSIQRSLALALVLRSDRPNSGVLSELVEGSRDPGRMIWRFWNTGRIPHRYQAANHLKSLRDGQDTLLRTMEPLLLEAALDPDMSVREAALGGLARMRHPALVGLASTLLLDADSEARLLGIQHLRRHGSAQWVPVLIPLFDDPDPRVVTSAAALLRTWTGNDFGLRQHMVLGGRDGNTEAGAEAVGAGVVRWKAWWRDNQGDYPPPPAPRSPETPRRLPVADFVLENLAGHAVRLSDFRGKVVVLNFWTTWCPSCLLEIPDLKRLQEAEQDRVVVLGISLDGVRDAHDHSHDHDHGDAESRHAGEAREQVRRFVEEHQINYRVLLDPDGRVGGRFNGHELPTNVLIDPEGRLFRRFVGARPLAVWLELAAAARAVGNTP